MGWLLLWVGLSLSHRLGLLNRLGLLLWIDASLNYLYRLLLFGLLGSLCLLLSTLSVIECNLDIASIALSIYSCLVQFDERNFVYVGDLFLNWLHVDDNLHDDSLNSLFYGVKVFRRSCELDSVMRDINLSLLVLVKSHHEL